LPPYPTGYYTTYANTVKLLETYKVPTLTFQSDNYLYNYESGFMIPTLSFPSNQTIIEATLDAFAKYSDLYDGLRRYLVPGYTKGVPAELQVSFGGWLRANGLEPLFPFAYLLVRAHCFKQLEGGSGLGLAKLQTHIQCGILCNGCIPSAQLCGFC
jgi:hypothetical protein